MGSDDDINPSSKNILLCGGGFDKRIVNYLTRDIFGLSIYEF
jgi:hypothetical protein